VLGTNTVEAVAAPNYGLAPVQLKNIREATAANLARHAQWTKDSGPVLIAEAL
jgi:hypothetical protein